MGKGGGGGNQSAPCLSVCLSMGDEEAEICSFCAFGQAGQLSVFSFNPIFPKRFIFSSDKINHMCDRSKRIGK